MASTTRGPGLWLSARAAATIIALGGPTLLSLVETLLGNMFGNAKICFWDLETIYDRLSQQLTMYTVMCPTDRHSKDSHL